MVRAGETGGQLDTVLMRVADNFEADYKLRQKVKSAMTYPVVVAGIAVILVTVMLLFVVPTFANMFTDLGGTLPLPTKILLTVSSKAKMARAPDRRRSVIIGFIVYKRVAQVECQRAPSVRSDQAEDPDLRGSLPEGRGVALHPYLGSPAPCRCAGASGARHRRGIDGQRGPGARRAGREGKRPQR